MAIEEKMMVMSVVIYKSFKGFNINIKLDLLSFSKKMTPSVFSWSKYKPITDVKCLIKYVSLARLMYYCHTQVNAMEFVICSNTICL